MAWENHTELLVWVQVQVLQLMLTAKEQCSPCTHEAIRMYEKLWGLFLKRCFVVDQSPAGHMQHRSASYASALSNYFIWMWAVLRHDGKGFCASILQCLHRPQCRQSYHNTCLRREQIWSMGPRGLYWNSSRRSRSMSAVWSASPGPRT